MVQGENSSPRRRNKRRGKGRNQATASAKAVNGHDRSDSSSSPGGPPAQLVRRNTRDYLANMLLDMNPYMSNMTRLQDAELRFYSSKVCLLWCELSQHSLEGFSSRNFYFKPTDEKSGTSPASEEVDLFASDKEEAVEAPALVNPAPKAKAAAPKKAEAAPKKVAEAAAWPNKAECNDAETKFQEELSKVPTMLNVVGV